MVSRSETVNERKKDRKRGKGRKSEVGRDKYEEIQRDGAITFQELIGLVIIAIAYNLLFTGTLGS